MRAASLFVPALLAMSEALLPSATKTDAPSPAAAVDASAAVDVEHLVTVGSSLVTSVCTQTDSELTLFATLDAVQAWADVVFAPTIATST